MVECERRDVEGGGELVISWEDWSESPREWCNIGHFLTWAGRYDSPDENLYPDPMGLLEELLGEFFGYSELVAAVAFDVPALEERGWKGGWSEVCDWDAEDDEECRKDALCEAMAEELAACMRLLDEKICILPVFMHVHSGVAYGTADFNDPWDSGFVGFIYATPADLDEAGIVPTASRKDIIRFLNDEVERYSQWANGEVFCLELYDKDGELIDSIGGVYDDMLEWYADQLVKDAA
mgnify:CR=1 FL=1